MEEAVDDMTYVGITFNEKKSKSAAEQLRAALEMYRTGHGRDATQCLCSEAAAAELGEDAPAGVTVTGRPYLRPFVWYVGRN